MARKMKVNTDELLRKNEIEDMLRKDLNKFMQVDYDTARDRDRVISEMENLNITVLDKNLRIDYLEKELASVSESN